MRLRNPVAVGGAVAIALLVLASCGGQTSATHPTSAVNAAGAATQPLDQGPGAPADSQWLSAIRVIYGSSDTIGCGEGWVKDNQDLNEGAGGDFIYLCKQFSTDPDRAMRPIGVSLDKKDVRNCTVPSDWDVDLNRGAGGSFIYFCSNAEQIGRLKNIAFTVWRTVPLPTPCTTSGWDPVYPDVQPGATIGWQLIKVYSDYGRLRGDLNERTPKFGRYIYTCQYRVDFDGGR